MPTPHDTAIPSDLLRLLADRAGRPALGRREADNTAVYAELAIGARRLALQAQRAADLLSAAAAESRIPPRCRCGNPLAVRETGRPAEYCSDRCRRAAGRARSLAA